MHHAGNPPLYTRPDPDGSSTDPSMFAAANTGARALYVDQSLGLSGNDGRFWTTAMQTIQEAVDAATTWTNIFIKAGIYEENVGITTQMTNLIGERRASVIIAPAVGTALTITADYCNISALSAQASSGISIRINGDRNIVHHVGVLNQNLQANGEWTELHHLKVVSAVPYAIRLYGNHSNVHDCFIDGAHTGVFGGNTYYSKIHDNEIKNCSVAGIQLGSTAHHTSIYHNNLIANAVQAKDEGTGNKWFENHYNDHTADTDHTGIADTAYAFTTGNDYHPCSSRNGWKRQTLGLAPT